MKRIIQIILLLLIAFFASLTWAEENIPSHLKSTPVTLMDFGLYRTNDIFHSYLASNDKKYIVNSFWSKKRKKFMLQAIHTSNVNKKTAQSLCKSIISTIKELMGVNPETNKPFVGNTSYFGAAFESYGSKYNESSEIFRTKMDKLVTIHVLLPLAENSETYECSSKLVG